MQIVINTDDLLSVIETAQRLRKSRWTIYRWISGGKINTVKIGGVYFIPETEVHRLRDGGQSVIC